MDFFLQTWFPGVLLGGYCLVYGVGVGVLAAKRTARGVAYGLHYGMLVLCGGLLCSAGALLALDQRDAVWQAYGVAGVIGLIVALSMGVAVKALFR